MALSYVDTLFGLGGQVAVVIGGTGVLGGALAEGLALAGASVIVSGRDPVKGKSRITRIQNGGGIAAFVPVDVMKRESIEKLLTDVIASHGHVDMLINGAGVNHAAGYLDLKDDDWDRVIDGNLKAVHWGCQIFGKKMAESGAGAILNIASASAHLPLSRVFAYSASKAAVVNLTQNVARELASSGVRVNALCPGFFPAEQNRKILDANRVEDIMRNTPMARFGEPSELVGAALLLLSRHAGSFITGASCYVDGGFTAMRF